MAALTADVKLDTSEAEAAIDRLESRIDALEERLRDLAALADQIAEKDEQSTS